MADVLRGKGVLPVIFIAIASLLAATFFLSDDQTSPVKEQARESKELQGKAGEKRGGEADLATWVEFTRRLLPGGRAALAEKRALEAETKEKIKELKIAVAELKQKQAAWEEYERSMGANEGGKRAWTDLHTWVRRLAREHKLNVGRSTPSKNIDRKFESFEKHTVNLDFAAPDNSLVNYLVALAKEPQMVRVSSLTIRRPNNNPQILTGTISVVASFPKQERELKGKYDRQSKSSPSTQYTKAGLIQKEDRFQKKRVHDELRAEYKKLQREHAALLIKDEGFRKKYEYDELRKKALECFYAVAVSLPAEMQLLAMNFNDRKESKQNLSVTGFVPTDLDQLVATFKDEMADFQVKDAEANGVSLFDKVEGGSIVEIPFRGNPMKRWSLSCELMMNRETQKEGRPSVPPRPPSGGEVVPVAKLTTKVPAQGKENTASPPKPSTGALKSAVDQNKTAPLTSPAVPSGSAAEGVPKPPQKPKFAVPMPLGGVDFGDIVRKNPFGLERPGDKPPAKVPKYKPAPPAKPPVRLSGIMALGGKKKVYLEIKVPGAGATPLYHALAESESANGVKVLSIDPVKGEVKLDIKGEEVTRSFDEKQGKGEPFASNRGSSHGSTSRGSSSRGSSSRGSSSSSRYNRRPTTPTRPPSGGGGALKPVPQRSPGKRSDAEPVKEPSAKLPLVRLTSVLLLQGKKKAYLEIHVPGASSPLYHQLQEGESVNGVKVIRIDRNRVVIKFEATNEERTVTFPEDNPAKARPSSPPKTSPGRLKTVPSRGKRS